MEPAVGLSLLESPGTDLSLSEQSDCRNAPRGKRPTEGAGRGKADLLTKAVFGAVNLQRRSVTGQPCRRLKRAAPKRALAPDKLAAMGNAFQLYITRTSSGQSPKKRRFLMNRYIGEQLHDINKNLSSKQLPQRMQVRLYQLLHLRLQVLQLHHPRLHLTGTRSASQELVLLPLVL
ncbi:hypothetical protein HPB47_021331 [Ixodes persulcatus]|uniref:Uncharacterized protein n=1 Tax=Ixodes persulcatus TaxID=34615 RepID=A0AC60QCZ6_IXOPE|nr:hypothetical protein HPB47_021331 [Ixodes persulcatus]